MVAVNWIYLHWTCQAQLLRRIHLKDDVKSHKTVVTPCLRKEFLALHPETPATGHCSVVVLNISPGGALLHKALSRSRGFVSGSYKGS